MLETCCLTCVSSVRDLDTLHLGGRVVKASASRVEDPGFEFCLRRDFSGSSYTRELNIWNSSGYPARRLAI